jgi:signal transduction histidine kinase
MATHSGSAAHGPGVRWATRALDIPHRLGGGAAGVLVGLGLAAAWFATDFLGGPARVSPQWFYLPIILAAVRFRYVGALTAGVAATVLAGPLMAFDAELGTSQPPAMWISRGCFFIFIALLVAALVDRVRTSLERELHLTREERDVARWQAGVTARVSHEFRTPLTVIKGVARTLEMQHLSPAESAEMLAGLVGATERLEDLVALVTTAAEDPGRIDTPNRQDLELRETLRRVVNRLPALGALERVHIRPGSEGDLVKTDRIAFERLLRELVENALKFSPRDAPVTVWTERGRELVEVHVLDFGPGVPDGLRQRAFDPFVRGDLSLTSPTEGLGVGLPAAANLAMQLGGSLDLRRPEGGGTEAVVALPA